MRFETRLSSRALCAGAKVGSFIFVLFACLNYDLYLLIQMKDDAKESLVRSCCP